MPNETLDSILQIPLFWRAAIVLFVFWFVYMLVSRLIFKFISLVTELFNWLWVLVYLTFNNLMHVIHKSRGKSMIGLDQSVTDFFGAVYGFVENFKVAVNNACRAKAIKDGKQQLDKNGKVVYTDASKKPFVGAALVIATVLVFWIAVPTWLNNETNDNLFTAAYHKYIETEGKFLDMVFGEQKLSNREER